METLPDIHEIPLSAFLLENYPFPHFGVTEAFTSERAAQLLNWFSTTDLWSLTKTDFYTQYEFSLIGIELQEPLRFLNSKETSQYMAERFDQIFCKQLKVIDITAHKLVNGHKMGVHNDFLGGAETHRLVIQLNDNWIDVNGGFLMLFNSKAPSDVAKIIRPLHNTGIGFEISERSYHAVSEVHDFNRYTLVYTFNAAE